MTIDELLQLGSSEIVTEVRSKKQSINHKEFLDEYDPEEHEVHDTTKRQKKEVTTDSGTTYVDVCRLSIPFQQIIVDRAAAFLVGSGIERLSQAETDQQKLLIDMLDKTWFDNKLDYKTKKIARKWMSETEVAELWYFKENPDTWRGYDLGEGGKFSLNMKILSYSEGDNLYPYFDVYGDMIAFGRSYKVNKVEHFDLYTDTIIRRFKKKADWEYEDEKNILGKIPIVYYYRPDTEWAHVQYLIERYETMLSNFADSNDYFASPMVKIKGEVTGFAEKGEQGKLITMEENADASYLTWDQAPEAIRLEKETLQELIFAMTQTPDISFSQMKGLGNISGVALKLMFLDADLKSKRHQEVFGEGMQRRINILKKAMSIISTKVEAAQSLQIEPEFRFYLPANEQELVNMLVTSVGSRPVMSQETAVGLNPFVQNVEREMERIGEDQAGQFGNIFDEA